MRKNEHPGCSCRACQRGKHDGGRFILRQINRRLRRRYRQALHSAPLDVVQIIVGTPYTD